MMRWKLRVWPDVSDKTTLCDLAPSIINHFYGTTKKTIREVLFSLSLHAVNKERIHVSVRGNQFKTASRLQLFVHKLG